MQSKKGRVWQKMGVNNGPVLTYTHSDRATPHREVAAVVTLLPSTHIPEAARFSGDTLSVPQ